MVLLSHLLAPVVALSAAVPGAWCSIATASETALEARAPGPLPVTGVREGGRAPRLEIRKLEKNHKMWNLFLQAMEKLQHEPEGHEASYYRIAGIHGRPYTTWDGSQGGGAGYCPHSSNLFGPWHRPYLALIEQRLHAHAVKIANQFPPSKRKAYRHAAKKLRLPYWDWAASHQSVMPASMKKPRIRVTRPNGRKVKIPNPLFAYRFHPLKPAAFANEQPYAHFKTTKRAPIGDRSSNANVENSLRGNVASNRGRVYSLLVRKAPYNQFSAHDANPGRDSLEGVHDNIHGSFGRFSHMAIPTYAAFDPAFWFHHANIDRLLAIWQHLHPHSYVKPGRQVYPTYTIAQGSTQNVHSPLTPFHRGKSGKYWTSAGARSTKVFGYTYPELRGKVSKKKLRHRVNKLYRPRTIGLNKNIADNTNSRSSFIDMDAGPDETLHQYIVDASVPLNPIGAPYSCALFLGAFNVADPSAWLTEPSYVGSNNLLGMPGQIDTTTQIPAKIVLTQALLERYEAGDLENLDQETVVAYLQENLRWKLQSNDQILDRSRAPGLNIQLLITDVKPATNETDFPNFLETAQSFNVTEAAV